MKLRFSSLKSLLATLALLVASSSSLFSQSVKAAVLPTINSGDTAWMIVATALVLLMTIPGLAFFYGGLVRQKNVLNILMQCIIIMSVITLQWVIFGYSISFGSGNGFIGGFQWAFLDGIKITDLSPYFVTQSQTLANGTQVGTIPHIIFVLYQCMFAVITPALIIGAFAERIKFKGFLLFSVLWAVIVYDPVAHWIWSHDGWLAKLGVLDFAGGIVVHVNAGVAALVTAVMIGRRRIYRNSAIPPHNIPFVLLGTGLLWFGWFGFNAGSGLAADAVAGNAFLVTHVAAAAAAFVWVMLDWVFAKKPTLVGICTGAVAGLATITPAAGYVDVKGALLIGISTSLLCFYMVGHLKKRFKYDDTLDAFGVHGVGGIWGSIAVGIFATAKVQNYSGVLEGHTHQLFIQLIGVGVTILYSAVLTILLFWGVDKLVGIRASKQEESMGLDETQHSETAYTSFE